MGAPFKHFIDQIPAENAGIEILESEKVMLLKPRFYILNQVTEVKDYHFVIPISTPPPTWIGKREYHFRKNSMVCFKPGDGVLNKIDAPTKEYVNICFNREFFEEIVREVTGKRNILKKVEYSPSPQLLQVVANFENEVRNYHGSCPLMLQSICVQLAIQVIRCTENDTADFKKYGRENNYVSKAIEYMKAYYNAGISIDDICREINLSPYYFIRLFKARTGETPYQYLLRLRLQQAEVLLEQGEYLVEEVARLCGFVHTGHFSSLYRRIKGMTPTEYRRKRSISYKK